MGRGIEKVGGGVEVMGRGMDRIGAGVQLIGVGVIIIGCGITSGSIIKGFKKRNGKAAKPRKGDTR